MSDNLVIVALPRKGEAVIKASSEKAAHVTLLFLGDNANVSSDILQYVEHAVETSFRPIWLEATDRGELGPDKADVLFFEGHGARQLAEFRSLLLKDPNIKTLYDANEQYDGFTPHLTLGYPAAPAKEPENEWMLNSVEVDRIAVWTKDSDGPEFKPPRPTWDYDDSLPMVMGETILEDTLAHYGKKGMKWGVVNEDQLVGGNNARTPDVGNTGGSPSTKISKKSAAYEKRGQEIAKRQGLDKADMQAKYGSPEAMAAAQSRQHEMVKKVAIGAGIGVAAAGIGYAAYKYKQSGGELELNPEFANALKDPLAMAKLDAKHLQNVKVGELANTTHKAQIAGLRADGLASNWDEAVNLEAGSVIKRLSSVAETTPRPDGFFGSFRDSDVESYRAVLPSHWRGWGMGDAANGGFINHYQAKEAIKAPSGKETFEIFKDLIKSDQSFAKHFAGRSTPKLIQMSSDDKLKDMLQASAVNWADANNQYTKDFTEALRKKGFNAVIDFNDAGKLGKTPLKILDGNIFDIVKNEPQTLDDFYNAAQKWSPELIHMLNQIGAVLMSEIKPTLVEEFLAHYGKKGMKWGVRKAQGTATDSAISVGREKGPQAVKTTALRIGPKTEIKTSKGGYNDVHPDAVAAKTAAQKKKRSGVDTLSNKELESLANRMNLEQRIRDLEDRSPDSDFGAARKRIQRHLAAEGLKQVPKDSKAAALGKVVLKASMPKKPKNQKSKD